MSQYTSYTVSVINGSNTVSGQPGTLFLSRVAPGNSFKVKGDPVIYTVSSVVSDTELTLSTSYAGATASLVQYQVTTDYTPNFGFAEINAGDQDWAVHLTQETIRKIDEVLGYAVGAGVTFKGTWDALANVPVVPVASVDNNGWTYIVAATGTTNINGITGWFVGDTLISNGSAWIRIPPPDVEAAESAASALASMIATAADRIQTGLDKEATATDRVQTGLDAAATAADRIAVATDKIETATNAVTTTNQVGIATTQAGIATAAAADAAGQILTVANNLIITQTIMVEHIAFV